jgi:hypothetical protein
MLEDKRSVMEILGGSQGTALNELEDFLATPLIAPLHYAPINSIRPSSPILLILCRDLSKRLA